MVFLKILNAPLRPVYANPVTFYKHYAYQPAYINIYTISNSCNMAMKDLPDMYAQSPMATGQRAEGIHIRQIMNGHVTGIMYHFVPIVTTPAV